MTETNTQPDRGIITTSGDISISLILQTIGGGGAWIASATDPITGEIQSDLTQQLQSLLNSSDITVAIKYDGRDEALDELAGDIRDQLFDVFNDWLSHQTYNKAYYRNNTGITSVGLTVTRQVDPDFMPVQMFIDEPLTDKVDKVGFNLIPSVLNGGQSWSSFPVVPGGPISENLTEYVDQVAFVSIEGGIEGMAEDGDNLMLLLGTLVPQNI